MSGRGLVLGGGGITGIAWELGLVAGLAELGVDLRSADRVVGTSAGSIVGAKLTGPDELEALYESELEPPDPAEVVATLSRFVYVKYGAVLLRTRKDLPAFGRGLGAMSLRAEAAGKLPSLESRFQAIRDRVSSLAWPERDLRVATVDAHSGEFRVFTSADGAAGVPLLHALAASCAVPAVYPPVPIGDRVYVDGGIRTSANADVASGCDRVVALTPMAASLPWIPSTKQQLAALGVPSVVVTPDRAALTAIGKNVLDTAARKASAQAGRAQAATVVDEVAAVWNRPPG